MDFSAIAYLFACQLQEELGVPVGVIDATWGGTPAEAWTSYTGLGGIKGFEQELDAMKRCNFDPAAISADYEKRMEEWTKLAGKTDINFDKAVYQTGKEWAKMPAGKNFDTTVLPSTFDGVVWAQYSFNVPAGSAGKPLTLSLCPIDDEDVTYLNGKEVARGSGYSTPRSYSIPAGILRDGENVPAKPVSTASSSYPTVLYNAMIYPLRHLPVRGTLWYQGCANVGRDAQYEPLFQSLISDWRKLFGKDMPFYFVQLAGFLQPSNCRQRR